jgi:TM2 domain-containing membrane protein YozV
MPTTEANSTVTATHTCPLCDAALDPAHPNECPKCDWVLGYGDQQLKHNNTRDVIAVFLSVIPGLGHIYKGYRMTGALYLLGSVFALFAFAVAATFTAGWALLLAPFYWAGVMLQVYWLEDKGVKQQKVA